MRQTSAPMPLVHPKSRIRAALNLQSVYRTINERSSQHLTATKGKQSMQGRTASALPRPTPAAAYRTQQLPVLLDRATCWHSSLLVSEMVEILSKVNYPRASVRSVHQALLVKVAMLDMTASNSSGQDKGAALAGNKTVFHPGTALPTWSTRRPLLH